MLLWIAVDCAIALLALVGFGLVCLRLWRQTKALGRALSDASDRVGAAQAEVPAVRRT